MVSIGSVLQNGTVLLTFIVLAVAYWYMLTMCEPYGRADFVYLRLAEESSYFMGLGFTAGLATIILVVLDVLYWKGIFWYLARLLILGNVGLYFLTALAGTERFPSSPIAVYFTVCPVLIYIMKMTVLRSMEILSFLWAVGASLVTVSVVSLGVFLAYAFGYGHFWDTETKIDYYIRLECLPETFALLPSSNQTTFLDAVDLGAECDEGFLYWISPIILVLFSFAMGAATLVIVHSQIAYSKGKSRIDLQVRAFITFLLLGFLGLWCACGIGGADVGMSSVVFAFTFLLMVIGCGAIVFVEGMHNFTTGVAQQPLVARVLGWSKSDWMRSLLLVLFFPLLFAIFPLAYLNQLGRKYLPMTKQLDEEERKLTLCIEVHKRVQSAKKWHWTSVLTKVIWWGVIFFSLSVIGARFINVFFSWLEEVFRVNNIGIGEASAIFVVVGWISFMLPPIPGVPVYIACSVIIVSTCMRYGWDFWVAWIYSSMVAWVMRLLAVAGEQMLIGQMLGSNSLWVKRQVNVNSVELRAIKKILLTKGMTKAKVATLVGGPDWPMCVTAGILRTSLTQNLLGTSPVILIILPVTLAGALILKRSEGGVWESAASMALAITALIQTIMLGAAAFYIEQTVQNHREELMSWPDDEEVKRFDEISNKKARARTYVSEWQRLPLWLKVVIWIGVVAETASAYIFQLFGSRCFFSFDITDSIEEDLNNNVLNIVKPLGWVGIGLFACGCVVLILLGRWISFKVRGGFEVPEEEEARQRRLSEAGLQDDDEFEYDAELAKENAAVVPVTDSK